MMTCAPLADTAPLRCLAPLEPVQPRRAERETAARTWANLETVLRLHHHNPDCQAARALYAAVAAHRLAGAPVWPMLVAPPGSLKTELLNALEGLPNLHAIDQVTPHTFISGQIDDGKADRKTPAGLLHRIGKSGILIYPDFSTILGMKRDYKTSVLADMRRIYDGHLHKEFGTADQLDARQWTGRITFVVAVTPAIDSYYSIFRTLGERFVMIRWPRSGGIEVALKAMNQDCGEAKRELQTAVKELFASIPDTEPDVPNGIQKQIAALTELVVIARTHIPRLSNKEIEYIPEPESATRLAQQLVQLAKGSALLEAHTEADGSDYTMVRRVAFDCIPPPRRAIIDCLAADRALKTLHMPASTLYYAKQELQGLGLLNGEELSGSAKELLATATV